MAHTTDHKESRASIRVVYRHYDIRSDGTCPFFICITKGRKRKYIATGLTLDPKFWDTKKNNTVRNFPPALKRDLEVKLKKILEKYEVAADTLAEADEPHDATAVANKAVEDRKRTRHTTLLAYMDTLVGNMIKAHETGNASIYHDTRNQLAKFVKTQFNATDITFDKVTVRFCNDWETELRAGDASDNTLSNRFRTLRAVLNKAIANGFAKPEHYPFVRNVAEKHKFSIAKFDTTTQKRAISRSDIRLIENYIPVGVYTAENFKGKRNATAIAKIKNLAETGRMTLAKEIFLFSFYAGGINFVDIAKLRWADLTVDSEGQNRLNFTRQKTKGKFSVRLLAPAISIVDSYRPLTFDTVNDYIFPILKRTAHQTESQIHNRIHKILGQVNTDLKLLGERAGISTPITTYVARHSFGTILRKSGVSDAVISQAYQHKTERTTRIYLDSFASETVDSAYDALL